MFDHFQGKLIRKTPTEVVVECGGVGYLLHVSLNTFSRLPAAGPVTLLAVAHYTENSQRLYGFAAEPERALFRLLHGVRGVGPALAMSMLSHESPEQLLQLLGNGDITRLTKIKGVGKKTAERLIVELRDRIPSLPEFRSEPSQEHVLVEALMSLGLGHSEATTRARETLHEADEELQVEELLRRALKRSTRSAAR